MDEDVHTIDKGRIDEGKNMIQFFGALHFHARQFDIITEEIMLNFTKMEALGNDYIYINTLQDEVVHPEYLARKMSNRHFGAGADGLILLRASWQADIRMEMYNADGSRAQMCGNGIRCLAKYAYVRGIVPKLEMKIETDVGIRTVHLEKREGLIRNVRVNMGIPQVDAVQQPIYVDERIFSYTSVSMGNPHVVLFVPNLEETKLMEIGRKISSHSYFPEGTNVEFICMDTRKKIRMRVWERGTGETLACGTGACAAMVAAHIIGSCEDEVEVVMPGGSLHIFWNPVQGELSMSGGAEFIYDGIWLGEI